jgi:transcriptional regulator with XRE-family HTH domain
MSYKYDWQVGQQIKKIREQKGWTQEELAAKLQVFGCDITRSALAKIESGQRHIYVLELKAFHTIFCVHYEDLLP